MRVRYSAAAGPGAVAAGGAPPPSSHAAPGERREGTWRRRRLSSQRVCQAAIALASVRIRHCPGASGGSGGCSSAAACSRASVVGVVPLQFPCMDAFLAHFQNGRLTVESGVESRGGC